MFIPEKEVSKKKKIPFSIIAIFWQSSIIRVGLKSLSSVTLLCLGEKKDLKHIRVYILILYISPSGIEHFLLNKSISSARIQETVALTGRASAMCLNI